MTSELYKNLCPSTNARNVWDGKRFIISRLAAFFRPR